jgi:hypothetical protein
MPIPSFVQCSTKAGTTHSEIEQLDSELWHFLRVEMTPCKREMETS